MENNIAMVIDNLCVRLGTTMENLVPAIVEFGKYDCQITARVYYIWNCSDPHCSLHVQAY